MVIVRYIYKGETLRNGRVLQLSQPSVLSEPAMVHGASILDALSSAEANVPMHRLVPFFYSKPLEGWQRLHAESIVALHTLEDPRVARVEVMLEQPATKFELTTRARALEQEHTPLLAGAAAAEGDDLTPERIEALLTESEGYFGIGVYNSKTVDNVGTLWRSAYMLGAAFMFTIGTRNAWEKSCDTYKSWRHVPAIRYNDFGAFAAAAPYQAIWVAVEMGGTPLHEFEHPERYMHVPLPPRVAVVSRTTPCTHSACPPHVSHVSAIYILGAEDAGLPASIIRACAHCIALDGVRASSYNVATAGTLIMYDRCQKLGKTEDCAKSSRPAVRSVHASPTDDVRDDSAR
jgi:tRNA G18 (ribose-2'-O)-methylase SpoU